MADSMHRPLVVIPALNEQASVGAVIADVLAHVPGARCVVVDDGSTDATAERARAAGAEVLPLPFNLGVGGAMRAGFRHAREHGYDVVIQVDADGQHDPRYIPHLIGMLADADIAIGARFAGAGEYGARGPRRWAMRVLAWALSRISGAGLTDATSGFKAHGPRAVRLFAHTYPAEYLGDTVEALVIAARGGLRIRQLPVVMRPRQGGTPSNGPLRSTMYLLRAGVALLLALVRSRTTFPEEPGR